MIVTGALIEQHVKQVAVGTDIGAIIIVRKTINVVTSITGGSRH